MLVRIVIFLAVLLVLIGLVALVASHTGSAPAGPPVPQTHALPIPEGFDDRIYAPLHLPLAGPRIEVAKAARRLYLYASGKRIRAYPIGLGANPVDPKRNVRDYRTPEGSYKVCLKNPNSKYYLALGLNYPSDADARRGLADGLITRKQYDEIVRANSTGGCPPWDTLLGGAIVIHGRGAGADWTAGCVALEDEDMRELFDAVPVGTPVLITK
jgi:murein L,D-transpeptidase YafK